MITALLTTFSERSLRDPPADQRLPAGRGVFPRYRARGHHHGARCCRRRSGPSEINQVHFGIIMGVSLAIGLCTPPYGCNLFVGAAVAKIKMDSMFKYIWPLLTVAVAALLVITYVPWLSLAFLK
ncbi:MAG: TRAP transporter large permease subunit [Desulfomicrobium escambiense]|nr:TRAP transporter large permease subunit [Desulfomicrobium escambiense]